MPTPARQWLDAAACPERSRRAAPKTVSPRRHPILTLATERRPDGTVVTYDYLKRLDYDKFEQRATLDAGNQVRTAYSYDPRNRRLCGLVSGKGTPATGCRTVTATPSTEPNAIQALAYQYDHVGNILGLQNQIPVPPPSQYGGPVTQAFVYDDLYRLTGAQGTFDFNPNKRRTYSLTLAYDSIHNIVSKQQTDIVTQPSGTPITQKKTSYNWLYTYAQKPHAPTHIGERTYSYDANGNQLGWDNDDNGTKRTIVWDEDNRIQSLFDNGHQKTYKYDDQGQRIIKRGPQGETAYINQYFTIRNKEVGTKHVFIGTTRLVSKLMKQDKPGANPQGQTPLEKDLYFYHGDHLGSSHYVTDRQGRIYEHAEYFPFGETWVLEATTTQAIPYLYTGKELDTETGLYYFGARYYDPRTSVWQSADPIDRFNAQSPTIGLNLYQYGLLNPIRYNDPTGLAEEESKGVLNKALQKFEEVKSKLAEAVGGLLKGPTKDSQEAFARRAGDDQETATQSATEHAEAASARSVVEAKKVIDSAAEGAAAILVTKGLGGATRVGSGLSKQLGSQEGVAELLSGGGKAIAGAGTKVPLRDAGRLVSEYGGKPGDWAKITSTAQGHLQTRAYRNVVTGQVVELKSIVP